MIDLASILQIVAASFGLWAVGYAAGKSSAYIRAIKSVA